MFMTKSFVEKQQKEPARTAFVTDFDGTVAPSIAESEKLGLGPHPRINEMIEEMNRIKKDGGVVIGNTGRPDNMINGDKTGLHDMPFDYICASVGTQILTPERQTNGSTKYVPMQAYKDYLTTPNDESKKPYDKGTVQELLLQQEGFSPQPEKNIGDSPRNGLYFTIALPEEVAHLANPEDKKNAGKKFADDLTQTIKTKVEGLTSEFDVKCGVSTHLIDGEKNTAILNVDVMPARADKIGATTWLLKHISEQRAAQGEEKLNTVVIAGDSLNDKSNMDTKRLKDDGFRPMFIAPGNAHPGLKQHITHEGMRGAKVSIGPDIPTNIPSESADYFNHPNYGLGGTLDALKKVLAQEKTQHLQF